MVGCLETDNTSPASCAVILELFWAVALKGFSAVQIAF